MRYRCALAAVALLAVALPAAAQLRPDIVYTDKINDSIIRVVDLNRNGTYGDPGEYTILHSRAAFTESGSSGSCVHNNGKTVIWAESDSGSPTGATNGIYRADLATGLGRINQSEATFVFNFHEPGRSRLRRGDEHDLRDQRSFTERRALGAEGSQQRQRRDGPGRIDPARRERAEHHGAGAVQTSVQIGGDDLEGHGAGLSEVRWSRTNRRTRSSTSSRT